MPFFLRGFLALDNNPMNTWDFKLEGLAKIWIEAGRLCALAWVTPQIKESLGADKASSLG